MALLEVKGLCKHYKTFDLKDISLSLPAGYICGYVGRNGAGKTTTLNALTHLIPVDRGDVALDGLRFEDDPIAYRDAIGYIGDASYFPGELTHEDIRVILKDFYPSFRPDQYDDYIRRWELPAKEKIRTYSRGMKVKLMFAAALSRDTKLLILDEATNGLDPVMRSEILRILQAYIDDGQRSVLFSTHIMDDLESIADYIFFIDNGQKVFYEAKDDILERYLLVKGGCDDLTPELKNKLIGVEESAYGFEGLYDTERGEALPAALVTDKPSIDRIIVHMIGGAR